jgi:hypothetical protein
MNEFETEKLASPHWVYCQRCQAFWEVTTQSKYGNQGYNNSWF